MYMSELTRPPRPLDRRAFLAGTAIAGGALLAEGLLSRPADATPRSAPFNLIRSGRPALTHGVQSGDVTADSAVVWARGDRPARMIVEVATSDSFGHARHLRGPIVTPATDLTGQLDLHGLRPGQRFFYRISLQDLHDPTLLSAPVVGQFRTAPARRSDLSFTWSGDTAGQGWGINPDFGGMRIYQTMRQAQPDFFIHSGDNIYADGPIPATVPLPDGTIWRNLTTEAKSKVAETLQEFRGNYQYNLLDDNLRRCYAEVPVLAQWDDHETRNNWYPGQVITDDRYTEKRVDVLAARARQAFLEYMPLRPPSPDPEGRIYRVVHHGPLLDVFLLDMRTYRAANSSDDQTTPSAATAFLGQRQRRWLQQQLARSRATWKVIAADLPLSLIVPDGSNIEAVANGDPQLLGRELEIAALLQAIKRQRVANVVWVTADVHYAAAHRYDPNRAIFQEFSPFWEFVAGPLNAGTFGPNALDPTVGPPLELQRCAPTPNQPPSAGLQFFGHITIDGATAVMTVRLKDLAGQTLFQVDLEPSN
jgi:alkaline phosphatase D